MLMIARFGIRAGVVAALLFSFPLAHAGGRALAQAAQTVGPQQTIAEKIAASKDLLDINTATSAQLKALPGMGDAYAARIIAGRPYTAKNQLTMRGILPPAAYDKIKPLIVAHRPPR
jgi:competence protein ComEA